MANVRITDLPLTTSSIPGEDHLIIDAAGGSKKISVDDMVNSSSYVAANKNQGKPIIVVKTCSRNISNVTEQGIVEPGLFNTSNQVVGWVNFRSHTEKEPPLNGKHWGILHRYEVIKQPGESRIHLLSPYGDIRHGTIDISQTKRVSEVKGFNDADWIKLPESYTEGLGGWFFGTDGFSVRYHGVSAYKYRYPENCHFMVWKA